MHLAVGAV